MNASIKIDGLAPLLKQLKKLDDAKPVFAAMRAAALHVKGKLATYPPQRKGVTRASVYGSAFKSPRQRKYFFANLKENRVGVVANLKRGNLRGAIASLGSGEIDVPYRRGQSKQSQAFGRRWTIESRDNGLTVAIGNNASYGPYLMDESRQSAYAKAMGWRTVQAIMSEEEATVIKMIDEEIAKLVQGI